MIGHCIYNAPVPHSSRSARPALSVFSIAVAACPPVALLLAVELLNRALKRHHNETTGTTETANETDETSETGSIARLTAVPAGSHPSAGPTGEQRMWTYYVAERSEGRTPTGAELDRIAGTNNYGRKVLRQWKLCGAAR